MAALIAKGRPRIHLIGVLSQVCQIELTHFALYSVLACSLEINTVTFYTITTAINKTAGLNT